MTTATPAEPQPDRPTSTLTVSAVPASVPPRSISGQGTALHRTPDTARPAWSPRIQTEGGPHPRTRARDEHRREEERHIRSLARVIALACVEAELGLRPARQLSAWLDLQTYGKMVRRADLASRVQADRGATTVPRALGSRCCPVGDGVYEASATVQLPDRVRAMALRIERHRNRWKVTALELG